MLTKIAPISGHRNELDQTEIGLKNQDCLFLTEKSCPGSPCVWTTLQVWLQGGLVKDQLFPERIVDLIHSDRDMQL